MKTLLNFRNNLVMLYKNIPDDKELKRVMRVRRFWDLVAALSFVAQGHFAGAKAVFKAHRQYEERRYQYDEARKANKAACVLKRIPEQYAKSILLQYYLHFCRKFSQLKW